RLLLLGRERLLERRRWHDLLLVRGQNAADEFALLRLTGDDGRLARPPTGGGRVGAVEPQLRLAGAVVRPVALEAARREDRPHVAVEVRRVGRAAGGGDREQNP